MRNLQLYCVAALLCLLSLGVGTVGAADKVSIRVLGGFTQQIQSTLIEEPFFKKLPQDSNGRVEVQFRTMDEVGQKGFQAMRQLKAGVFDIMEIQLGYVSGDDAFFQGVDLVGVAPDIQTARKTMEAYREAFDKRLQERFEGKLLALWPYGDQIFWFKGKIGGLADFKGKKIRVFSRPMADFVQYFGGIGVSMAFPEVYTSLQRGVVDGAVTGALAGNTASWYEVSDYIYPMPVGYSLQAHVANLKFWNGLSADVREFLTKKMRELENEMWRVGAEATEFGVNCNVGKDPCKYGKKGKMTLVPVSAEDKAKAQKAAEEVVLPKWAKDCTAVLGQCAEVWNGSVGKAAGIRIK
jgi:TRAP-type C4-dicarboxylate transport system substrate-binding protein